MVKQSANFKAKYVLFFNFHLLNKVSIDNQQCEKGMVVAQTRNRQSSFISLNHIHKVFVEYWYDQKRKWAACSKVWHGIKIHKMVIRNQVQKKMYFIHDLIFYCDNSGFYIIYRYTYHLNFCKLYKNLSKNFLLKQKFFLLTIIILKDLQNLYMKNVSFKKEALTSSFREYI